MAKYRNRETGEIKSQGEIRKDSKMSLPKVWDDAICDLLNIDVVLPGPMPQEIGKFQKVVQNGFYQDENGNWRERWELVDKFSDYTDEDGNLVTKAQQEANWDSVVIASAAKAMRIERDTLLAETDWWASVDLTMSEEQIAYRQALRDITTHENWPNLEDADWPIKP